MKMKNQALFAMLSSLLILGACSAEETGVQPSVKEEAPKVDEEAAEKIDSPEKSADLKVEYLRRLTETKQKTDEMRAHPEDDTTIAMKKVEGDIYDIWDGLLNEIYGVLEEQLPAEEMKKLREEQREWIAHRDKTAKEASLKYEGGTMEQLEYVRVENDLTEERCFELVENYMK